MTSMRNAVDRVGGAFRHTSRRVERLGRGTGSFVVGKGKAVVNRSRPKADMDDTTLKNKVETILFRPQDAPKGSVNIDVVDRVVELRGEVKRPEIKKDLERKARKIPEVRDVRNLLHLPKTPAPGRADSPGRQRRRSA
jgi:osmotically-inducible protein OsmY